MCQWHIRKYIYIFIYKSKTWIFQKLYRTRIIIVTIVVYRKDHVFYFFNNILELLFGVIFHLCKGVCKLKVDCIFKNTLFEGFILHISTFQKL